MPDAHIHLLTSRRRVCQRVQIEDEVRVAANGNWPGNVERARTALVFGPAGPIELEAAPVCPLGSIRVHDLEPDVRLIQWLCPRVLECNDAVNRRRAP